MKITRNGISFILCLLGLAVAYAGWQFGYVDLNAKKADLEAQNAQLEADIKVYEAWVVHESDFIASTVEMDAEIENWFQVFPSNVLVDDEIKLAYQLDNDNLENYLFINSMSFGETEELYVTNYAAHAETETTNLLSPITIDETLYPTCSVNKFPVTIGMNCTYSGLKNFVERLYSGNKRRAIESISVEAEDSTGQLVASVVINAYYLTGTDKGYAEPSLPAVKIGSDNIFGTMEVMLPDYITGGSGFTDNESGEAEADETENSTTD